MQQISTKQKILHEALNLFSRKGYDAVSVGEIAEAVGIKAPSLYKHYQSKQHIFDAILSEMEEQYKRQAASMQIDGIQGQADAEFFTGLSEQFLIKMGKEWFLYYLHDEYLSKFRRMLTIGQYDNQKLGSFYSRQYFDTPVTYQSAVFERFTEAGLMKPGDSKLMALHFYAPLYSLLILCDREPERETEALEILEQHILQFQSIYVG